MKRAVMLLVIISILCVSLVSASWFSDFIARGKVNQGITGNAVANLCSDTDSGDYKDIKGIATVRQSFGRTKAYTDVCQVNKLTEYYCSGNSIRTKTYTCENGCSDGACKQAVTCTDSDGGKDYYAKGITTSDSTYSGGTKEDFCATSGDGTLFEYWCTKGSQPGYPENNYITVDTYSCPNGCLDGACVQAVTCTDSDGGKNYYTKGSVKLNPPEPNVIEYVDSCTYPKYGLLTEYYCDSNGKVKSEDYTCPEGCSATEGACKSSQSIGSWYKVSKNYYDPATFVNGTKVQAKWLGTCQNVCEDIGLVAVPQCLIPQSAGNLNLPVSCRKTESSPDVISTISESCYEVGLIGNVGEDYCCCGKISLPSSAPTLMCDDKDGGKNYIVKANTCRGSICITDYCLDNKVLAEGYCREDDRIIFGTYTCPNGCSNGICLS